MFQGSPCWANAGVATANAIVAAHRIRLRTGMSFLLEVEQWVATAFGLGLPLFEWWPFARIRDRRCGRERVAQRNDDAPPDPCVVPAVILFVDVGRQVGLQDHRSEVVPDKSAHRELALFLISRKRRVQIGGVITDG